LFCSILLNSSSSLSKKLLAIPTTPSHHGNFDVFFVQEAFGRSHYT